MGKVQHSLLLHQFLQDLILLLLTPRLYEEH